MRKQVKKPLNPALEKAAIDAVKGAVQAKAKPVFKLDGRARVLRGDYGNAVGYITNILPGGKIRLELNGGLQFVDFKRTDLEPVD